MEMLNILRHQRNANQKNTEIPFYICQNGQDQKHWLMLKRMWGRGNSPLLLVEMQTDTAALQMNVVIS